MDEKIIDKFLNWMGYLEEEYLDQKVRIDGLFQTSKVIILNRTEYKDQDIEKNTLLQEAIFLQMVVKENLRLAEGKEKVSLNGVDTTYSIDRDLENLVGMLIIQNENIKGEQWGGSIVIG